MKQRFDIPYGSDKRLKISFTDSEIKLITVLYHGASSDHIESILTDMLGSYIDKYSTVRGFKKHYMEVSMSVAASFMIDYRCQISSLELRLLEEGF